MNSQVRVQYCYRLSEHRQLPFSKVIKMFDVSAQSKPDFDSKLTWKFGLCPCPLRILQTHAELSTHVSRLHQY